MTKENKRKIVICGTGAGYERAPFDKAGYELWGITGHWSANKKFDRIYEVHSANSLSVEGATTTAMADFLLGNNAHIHPTLQASFPKGKVVDFEKHIKEYGRSLFRCTISWMLAEAIEEKPEAIEIYGVTLSGKEEYRGQKPSVAAFVAVARKLGIKVYVDREDELFSCPWVYGYEDVPGFIQSVQDKGRKIERQLYNTESEVLEKRAEFNRLEGQQDVIDWLKDSYGI